MTDQCRCEQMHASHGSDGGPCLIKCPACCMTTWPAAHDPRRNPEPETTEEPKP